MIGGGSGRRTGRPDTAGLRERTPAELDALLAGGASGSAPLDEVLSAVRVPANAHEVAGLDAAANAIASPAPPLSRTRWVLARAGAATLATKAATAVVGAAAIGGVAYAGATGHLPVRIHRAAPPVTSVHNSSPASGPSASDTLSHSPSPSSSSSGRSTRSSTSRSASPTGSLRPTPNTALLADLCRDWLKLPSGLDGPRSDARYRVLFRAAGGRQSTHAFCIAMRVSGGPPVTRPPRSSGSTTAPGPSGSRSSSGSPTPTGTHSTGGSPRPSRSSSRSPSSRSSHPKPDPSRTSAGQGP